MRREKKKEREEGERRRREEKERGEVEGTTVSFEGIDPRIKYRLGIFAFPQSSNKGIPLTWKQLSSICAEHKAEELVGTKFFLWIRTNRFHFYRKLIRLMGFVWRYSWHAWFVAAVNNRFWILGPFNMGSSLKYSMDQRSAEYTDP